jgi:hypothetical protein
METPPKVVITISYDHSNGALSINAPLDQKILCFGLLEAAKKIISDFNAEAPTVGQIVVPSGRVPV